MLKNLIRYDNTYKKYWDLFVIILAVINSLATPIEIGYPNIVFMQSIFMIVLNNIIDFCFILDVLFAFNTTYLNKLGEEVLDKK
jgi:hypothetical protein